MWRGRVLTAAGPRGRQCRRPAPSAPCSRAQAPRAGGLGAAFRFGWGGEGVDGGRPTSRGLPPAGRWSTLPCPGGQGALPVCGVDAVCPAGKGAAEWRAGSWRVAGESGFFGAVCPSGKFTSAPGNGGTGRTPQGTEIHAISQTERAFSRQNLPHHPTAANAALYKARLIARVSRRTSRCVPPAFRACLQPTRAFYDLSAPFAAHPAPLTAHPAPFTAHPAPFTAHPTPFAAYSALFTAYSAPFTAFPHLLRPLHACLRPIRAFNSHPVPFYGFPTPFTTTPRLFMT